MRGRWSPVLLVVAGLVGAAPAHATTIPVSTTADPTGPGSCPDAPCSLRQAVASAHDGDVIQLAGTPAAPATYALTQGATVVIGTGLTLQGGGQGATTIDAAGNNDTSGPYSIPHRPFKVTSTATIRDLTITHGVDSADEVGSGSTLAKNGGGAIFTTGTLTVSDVAIVDGVSSATPLGGGIANTGTLDLEDVLFRNDYAAFGGGLSSKGGTVTANRVTFDTDGPGAFAGGAVFLTGGATATFTDATVVGNGMASSRGGGIYNSAGTLTVRDSTFADNLRGALETVTGASTSVGTSILGAGFDDGGDFACVPAGLSAYGAGNSVAAITHDLGHNLDQDGHCGLAGPGSLSGVDPGLTALGTATGGLVPVRAIDATSPAFDAGPATCSATDARRLARPQGAACDIGAYEATVAAAVTPTPTPTPDPTPAPLVAAPGPPITGTPGPAPTPLPKAALAHLPTVPAGSSATLSKITKGVSLAVSDLAPGSKATAKVKLGSRVLTTLHPKASTGGTLTVKVKLSKAQAKAAKGRSITVTFTLVAADGTSHTATVTIRVH